MSPSLAGVRLRTRMSPPVENDLVEKSERTATGKSNVQVPVVSRRSLWFVPADARQNGSADQACAGRDDAVLDQHGLERRRCRQRQIDQLSPSELAPDPHRVGEAITWKRATVHVDGA